MGTRKEVQMLTKSMVAPITDDRSAIYVTISELRNKGRRIDLSPDDVHRYW